MPISTNYQEYVIYVQLTIDITMEPMILFGLPAFHGYFYSTILLQKIFGFQILKILNIYLQLQNKYLFMYPQKPKKEKFQYCINTTQQYAKHWEYKQGLREIYQNWFDASLQKHPDFNILVQKETMLETYWYPCNKYNQILQKNYISYSKDEKCLIFENDKKFKRQALILGCTDKKNDNKSLGQFGEGMKLAMICLMKNNQKIEIESGDCCYLPVLKQWHIDPEFIEQKALYVQLKEKSPQDITKVKIQNLPQEEWNAFRYTTTLALIGPNQIVRFEFEEDSIIFSKKIDLQGKIFKKGILIPIPEGSLGFKLKYSYDINEIEVGRDRDSINNIDFLKKRISWLNYKLCQSYQKLIKQNRNNKDLLNSHYQTIYNFLQQNSVEVQSFAAYCSNTLVSDKLYKMFLSINKLPKELYPITSSYDNINTLKKQYGFGSQFYPYKYVSRNLFGVLRKSKHFKSLQTKIKQNKLTPLTQILSKTQQSQIQKPTDQQLQKINQKIKVIKNTIGSLFSQVNSYKFEAKKTNFNGFWCRKQKETIFINTEKIKNPSQQYNMIQRITKIILNDIVKDDL